MVKVEDVISLGVVGAAAYIVYKISKGLSAAETAVKDTFGATGAGLSAASGGTISKDTGEAYLKNLIQPNPVTQFSFWSEFAEDIQKQIKSLLPQSRELPPPDMEKVSAAIKEISPPLATPKAGTITTGDVVKDIFQLPASVRGKTVKEIFQIPKEAQGKSLIAPSYAPVPASIQHVAGSVARVGNITRGGKVVVYA